MKADQNGPFFQPEEWKSMLRKGMPPELQAVGKAPPKNPGLKPRGSVDMAPEAKVPEPERKTQGVTKRKTEGGLVFRINLFRKCVV